MKWAATGSASTGSWTTTTIRTRRSKKCINCYARPKHGLPSTSCAKTVHDERGERNAGHNVRKHMVFALATDDGGLMAFPSAVDASSYCEGIDVKDAVWLFFPDDGSPLEA